jgi:hypothetical protein
MLKAAARRNCGGCMATIRQSCSDGSKAMQDCNATSLKQDIPTLFGSWGWTKMPASALCAQCHRI